MKRILSMALIAVLVLAATAVAAGKGAKTYRAKLEPVAPATVTGKAHLVDGKKNNFVTVHVKGLTAGTTYPWHVHTIPAGEDNPCEPGATQGPIDTRFTYGTLTGNEDGNGSAKGKSTTFNWGDAEYYVNVHDPATGTPIACGVLERKASKAQPKGKA